MPLEGWAVVLSYQLCHQQAISLWVKLLSYLILSFAIWKWGRGLIWILFRSFQLHDLNRIQIECCITLSVMTILESNTTLTDCLFLFVSKYIDLQKELPIKPTRLQGTLYVPYLKASFELVVVKRLADHRLFLVPVSKPLAAHRTQFKIFILIVLYCVFLTFVQTSEKHVSNHTTRFRQTLRHLLFCSKTLNQHEESSQIV